MDEYQILRLDKARQEYKIVAREPDRNLAYMLLNLYTSHPFGEDDSVHIEYVILSPGETFDENYLHK